MARRFFEGEQHAALYAQLRPRPPQMLVDRIVSYLHEKYEGDLSMCVDVGCGSGQCTDLFAPHFKQVLGTDVSAAQINAAKAQEHPSNVEFQVCPAEHLVGIKSSTVQIVNATAAAHFFNLPTFFKEADRILCSNGVIALSCYNPQTYVFVEPANKSVELQQKLKTFFIDELSPFYGDAAECIKLALSEYEGISIPYQYNVRENVWTEERSITLAAFGAMITTWSPYQNLVKIEGEAAGQELVEGFISSCQKVLETTADPESIQLKLKLRYFLLMGRKD